VVDETLRNEVEDNLEGSYEWEEVEDGLNTIYLLKSEEESYIIKTHTNENNEAGWFRAESRIYEIIQEETENIPSPEIIYRDFSGKEYENSFYIMEALSGRNPNDVKEDCSDEQLKQILNQYGRMLGEIHRIEPEGVDDYGMLSAEDGELHTSDGAERWSWSLKGKMDAWKDMVEEEWEEPPEIDVPSQEEVDERVPEEPEPVLNHSDNRLDNLLVEDGEITGFIDWSHPGAGHSEYDLARAEYLLIDWDLTSKDEQLKEELREELYDGYRDTNSVSEDFFEERRQLYRQATTHWLAAGFSNWGSQLDEEEHEKVRESILSRLEKEGI